MVGGGSAPSQLSFPPVFVPGICPHSTLNFAPCWPGSAIDRKFRVIPQRFRVTLPAKGGSNVCCASRIQEMHVHSHGAAHNHSHTPIDASQGMTLILGTAVVATFALVAVELIAGYAAHSIALISDALHNLTDVPTMVISWLAARWAMRPPTPEKTYGYHRAGILAAFINSMLLSIVALFLIYESIQRLRVPVEVESGVMLWVSILALVINSGITFALHSGRRDLNIRAVWIHNLGDALSNIAIIAGAIVIRRTGANWIDPIIGIAIGAMVLWTGAGILRESTHILLEGLPRNIDLKNVAGAILKVDGVQEVHDIHIWTLGTDLHALSCHARIPDMHMEDSEKILNRICEVLARDFQISHTTVQLERAGLPAEAGPLMPGPPQPAAPIK